MAAILECNKQKSIEFGFEFVIDVSLDSDNGVFRRYHVVANPINLIDPTGLICGDSKTDKYIPDFPYGFNFAGPCQKHDDCYGCEGARLGMSKSDCDNRFCVDLMKECIKTPLFGKCMVYAGIYCFAVKKFGGEAFTNSRKNCCPNKIVQNI